MQFSKRLSSHWSYSSEEFPKQRLWDYEKARPSAGLSQKSGATKLEHSGTWQWTFLEALVKWAKTQTQELSLKAGAFARRRLFLKSYHSPIPHTPVLIIIWWNAKKNLYNMSINECIGLMDMLYNLFHHFIKLSHTFEFTFGLIMVLIGLLYHST